MKSIAIIGQGQIGKSTLVSSLMQSHLTFFNEVELKECHKSELQKKAEVLRKLRNGLSENLLNEYLLIQKKESKLSRTKRDYIERRVQRFVSKGVMTQDELNLIKL